MYTHTGVLNAILYTNINNNTKTNQHLNKHLHTGVLNATPIMIILNQHFIKIIYLFLGVLNATPWIRDDFLKILASKTPGMTPYVDDDYY